MKRGRTWGLLIRLGTEAGSAGTLISGKTKWVERLTDAVYAQSASCQQETDSQSGKLAAGKLLSRLLFGFLFGWRNDLQFQLRQQFLFALIFK
jgi:hypothetical protein